MNGKLPNSHKTILVLDHGPRFSKDSGVVFPITIKDATGTAKEVSTMKKTIWTWCVECSLEFHRVVSDLYSDSDRLLRFAIADSMGRLLQKEWTDTLITRNELVKAMTAVGPPTTGDDMSSSITGLLIAIEGISHLSPHQMKNANVKVVSEPSGTSRPEMFPTVKEKMKTASGTKSGDNRGHIIMFTNYLTKNELCEMLAEVEAHIIQRNKIISNLRDESLALIDHISLHIINTFSSNEKCDIVPEAKTVSELLSYSIVSRCANDQLVAAAHSVCIEVYDLVSTTVSGIPMKEETQPGHSVNYDVELLHPREAHEQLEQLGMVGANGFLREVVGDNPYPTFRLSWATPSPKTAWNLFPRTRHALRVTPSAVTSRPSLCLTSFLLGGRNVMLECSKIGPAESLRPNVGQKLISHTLIAHSGQIYIHSIAVGDIKEIDNLDDLLGPKTAVRPLPISSKESEEEEYISFSDGEIGIDFDMDDKADSCSDSKPIMEDKHVTPEPESSGESDSESDDGSLSESESDWESSDTDEERPASLRKDDFCKLMKECTLQPVPATELGNDDEDAVPCAQPIRTLRRVTRYWPMVAEETVIFQAREKFEPLLTLITHNELSAADVGECEQVINKLAKSKKTDPILPEGSTHYSIQNASDSEEQNRLALNELAFYMGNYINHSEKHAELLNLFLQTSGIDRTVNVATNDVTVSTLNRAPIVPLIHPADYGESTDSRSSSPSMAKRPRKGLWRPNESIPLYDIIYGARDRQMESTWRDFVGRTEQTGRVAQLYKNLDLSNAPSARPTVEG